MWWICTSSGTLSEESYSRLSDINAGEDHITYPCAMLTIYHYDTKIRYHRKDFLCHEGCFIIAHQLRYRRTSLEENRHLEIIHVILSAAKDLASLPKRSKARAQDDRPDPSQARSREVLSPNVYSRGLWIYQSTCRSAACLRPGLPPCVDAFLNGHAIREAP